MAVSYGDLDRMHTDRVAGSPFCKMAALESAAVVSGKMLLNVANPPLMLLTKPNDHHALALQTP
jgi:hypothetical protein